MTRQLRWTERATEQLAVIAEYISITSPVYAEQAVERIAKRFEQVQAFPESGPCRSGGTRERVAP